MDDITFRRHSRYAFKVILELNAEGFAFGFTRRTTLRQMVNQLLHHKGGVLLRQPDPVHWHERCLIAWLWLKNEAMILDALAAIPLERWSDNLEARKQALYDDV